MGSRAVDQGRYHFVLELFVDEIIRESPPAFLVRDIAGVSMAAGMHFGLSFAARYPDEARRLRESYEEAAELTDAVARVELDRAMRALRSVVLHG